MYQQVAVRLWVGYTDSGRARREARKRVGRAGEREIDSSYTAAWGGGGGSLRLGSSKCTKGPPTTKAVALCPVFSCAECACTLDVRYVGQETVTVASPCVFERLIARVCLVRVPVCDVHLGACSGLRKAGQLGGCG